MEAVLSHKTVGFIYDPTELLLNPFDDTDIVKYTLISNPKDLQNFLKAPIDVQEEVAEPKEIFNMDKRLCSAFIRVSSSLVPQNSILSTIETEESS